MRNSTKYKARGALVAAVSGVSVSYASAALTIYGNPNYVGGPGGTGGYTSTSTTPIYNPSVTPPNVGVSVASGESLFGVGNQYYPNVNPTAAPNVDSRDAESYVITPSGPVLLAPLATNPATVTGAVAPNPAPGGDVAYAINSTAGLVVGVSTNLYSAAGASLSTKAVYWTTAATTPYTAGAGTPTNPTFSATSYAVTAYPDLNPTANPSLNALSTVNASGYSTTTAYAVNSNGVAIGNGNFYLAGTSTFNQIGSMEWASTTSAPTPLYLPGAQPLYGTDYAINDAGTIVGKGTVSASSTVANPVATADVGQRAIYWAPGATYATLLPTLGTVGSLKDVAYVIGSTGVIGGTSQLTSAAASQYAVRWLPSTSGYTAQQLSYSGSSNAAGAVAGNAVVYGVDAAGDALGRATAYETATNAVGPTGTAIAQYASLGVRGYLWTAGATGATTPIVLAADGTSTTGSTTSYAFSINDAGFSVGKSYEYSSTGVISQQTDGSYYHAMLWNNSGAYTDLYSLLSPSQDATATTGGWVSLDEADAITNDGWISGYGYYDPDGTSNPLPAYESGFLINDAAASVPEPTSAAIVFAACGGALVTRRRRRTT